MRLIRRHVFVSLSLAAIAFVLAGIIQWWFECQQWAYRDGEFIGYIMPEPDVLFFHLNPRLDRLIYWLLHDTAICWLFIALADQVGAKSYMNFPQRVFSYVIGVYFFAEMLSGWVIQLFYSGKSYQDWWLLVVCILIFGYKSYADERAHNRRSRINGRN